MTMRTKIAIAASALAMLLCTGHPLSAQDAPTPAATPEKPNTSAPATTAPPAAHPQRVRIGGNVAQKKMIHQVQPVYPQIAKTAHVQGTVILHAIIAKGGTIQELQYVSGPALLMRSAMDAVRQWRYEPTLLNGEPVEVDTKISIVFTLGGDPPAAAPDQDAAPKEIDPQFKADVTDLLDAMNFRDLFARSVKDASSPARDQMLKILPATPNRDKIADEYFDKLAGLIQRPEALEGLVRIYAKYLTDDDIKAATKFYQTPAGKRVLQVLPKLQGEAVQWGARMASSNSKDIWVELCHEYPELKGQVAFCPGEAEKSSTLRNPNMPDRSGNLMRLGTD
jgi:TonB family protein